MELLLYSAAFTLWQCLVSMPHDGVAFASFFGRRTLRRGPGYILFSPWPGDLGVVLTEAELPSAPSLAEFRAALERVRRELLPLHVACEIYVLFVFVGVPALIAWFGSETAWRLALPTLGVLHVGTLATLYAAERRGDRRAKGRLERWIRSALFPPALFRTPAELRTQLLAGFHPATAAAALLDEDSFVRWLRKEIGRLGSDGNKQEAVLGLCEQRGIDRTRVIAPARIALDAVSYCPLCLDEFRIPRGRCLGCGTVSIAYEGAC